MIAEAFAALDRFGLFLVKLDVWHFVVGGVALVVVLTWMETDRDGPGSRR